MCITALHSATLYNRDQRRTIPVSGSAALRIVIFTENDALPEKLKLYLQSCKIITILNFIMPVTFTDYPFRNEQDCIIFIMP